jgi:hypothetical protein
VWGPFFVKHRFLLHQLNHTILCVDITEIGLSNEIYPPEGKNQMVLSTRFQSWKSAEAYLLQKGASEEGLGQALVQLNKAQLSALTIQ